MEKIDNACPFNSADWTEIIKEIRETKTKLNEIVDWINKQEEKVPSITEGLGL